MNEAEIESVQLPRRLAIELLHLAQSAPGEEVCGLVAARGGKPARVIPMQNVATDRHCRFEMDERELIDTMKSLRERGETLFATWHSHPQGPPELSSTDLERLGYPEALHLVVSLNTKGVLQINGWRLDQGAPIAMRLVVSEAD